MKLKRVFVGLGIFLILLLLLSFFLRSTLLQWSFNKAETHFYHHYGLHISAADFHFSGLDKIQFKDFVVQPDSADALLRINLLELNIAIADLLT
ncbi:MAG: hypothetical protein V4615_17075, partial [Bacteroidota bacterium]